MKKAIIAILLLCLLLCSCGTSDKATKNGELGVKITYTYQSMTDKEAEDVAYQLYTRLSSYSDKIERIMDYDNKTITLDISNRDLSEEFLRAITMSGKKGKLLISDKSSGDSSLSLTNEDVKDAYVPASKGNGFSLIIEFTDEGKAKYEKLSGKASISGKTIYFIFDDKVVSSLKCEEKLSAPSISINGGYSREEAGFLALLIQSGMLPEDLRVKISD